MNYQHLFHAGNFADVHKHILLFYTLQLLQQKESPLLLIDTHAGQGRYDFWSDEARRNPEYQRGIQRYIAANPRTPFATFAKSANQTLALRFYLGSPCILAQQKRPNDTVLLCETHDATRANLQLLMGKQRGVRVKGTCGYAHMVSVLPAPRPARALVLIDPPFEQPNERAQCLQALQHAFAKMNTATFMVWSPLTQHDDRHDFIEAINNMAAHSKRPTAVYTSLLKAHDPMGSLHTSVVQIVNPPFGLHDMVHTEQLFLKEIGVLTTHG